MTATNEKTGNNLDQKKPLTEREKTVQIVEIKKDVIEVVESQIKQYQQSGDLHFPPNYSPQNALKEAWLMLQDTVDMNRKPALEVCTRPSISNALFRMVVEGLNPGKNQCYFIVYGNKLNMQRSYFGAQEVAMMVDPTITEITKHEIYEGDEFEFEIRRGNNVITSHKTSFGNIKKSNIIGAYCSIFRNDGSEVSTIMTLDEIKDAWKMSKMNPVNADGKIKEGSTHDKFTASMALKTVINRACTAVINKSDDKSLLVKLCKQSEIEMAQEEAEAEIKENANLIDIEFSINDDVPDRASETDGEQLRESTTTQQGADF